MDMEEMARRLERLEAVEEIKQLQHRYIFHLLNNQWKEMSECFAENAYANIWRHGAHKGRDAIFKLFSERIANVNPGGERPRDAHFTVMPVIAVDGDRAAGYWMLYIFVSDPKSQFVARYNQGRYDCEYVKENRQWKFSKLVWTNPWPVTPQSLPRPEDWQ